MRGHIRKRGKKWAAVVFLGFDENGKRKYKWFGGFGTRKAAEKFLAEKLQELHKGAYVEPSDEPFGTYLLRWLEDKRMHVKQRTYEIYRRIIRIHVAPHIGNIPLSKLKSQHLRELYTRLQQGEKPLSNRYVGQIHTMLHDALETAVRWELIPRNPADAVKAPRPENKQMKFWTMDEVRRFLEAAEGDRFYIAFLLAITTGMRLGEILALKWSDIDIRCGRIHVQRTVNVLEDGTWAFTEPKSAAGRRMVAIPKKTIEALKKYKHEQDRIKKEMGDAYEDNDLVISRRDGGPVRQTRVREHMIRIAEKADVPAIRFHDLRHTHASLLLEQGVHPKIVSERLGHSKVSITLDTYSHVLPGLQEQVAESFAEALFGSHKDR